VRVNQPGLILGYHGTDLDTAEKVIHGKGLQQLWASEKDFDWLGRGIYFWENSQRRAEAWALERFPTTWTVIGAVIQLGVCLDLLDQKYCDLVDTAAKQMTEDYTLQGIDLPGNKGKAHRYDCALLEYMKTGKPELFGGPYDSARAAFVEGKPIAGISAFHHQTHIQLAVYNPNCIKGYFWPQVTSLETSSVSSAEG
jgi:hypothetical protein